jgi:23S rRNA (cytosine1962-C5)-methyltransferase
MNTITLKKDKEEALKRRHPWIFSGAIAPMETEPQEGDLVQVQSFQKKILGVGHYQKSSIAVRMLSFESAEINQEFWNNKISSAFNYRKKTGIIQSTSINCYRLVFGESDGLPGLILDVYHDAVVFQAHSVGMHRDRLKIVAALQHVFGSGLKTVYDKSKESLPGRYAESVQNGFLLGEEEGNVIIENGNSFYVNWVLGQKTGFFLDQRENRALLANYAKDKKILNTFCYTGGFSVYAGKSGARMVHSVDSSKRAIELTQKNMELNELKDHLVYCEDVFDFLKSNPLDYDIVILDPPAFAKHRDAKHKAVIGYKNLNALTLKKMNPGSLLFTFSCTQVVDKQLFFNTVAAAAIESGREVRILHYLHQPADHPINPLFPESEYLKGLVLYVD